MILVILDDGGEGDRSGKLIVEEYGSIDSTDPQSEHRRQPTMIQRYEWLPGAPPPPFSLPVFPFFETIPAAFGGQSEINVSPHTLPYGWENVQDAWARTLKERRAHQGGA